MALRILTIAVAAWIYGFALVAGADAPSGKLTPVDTRAIQSVIQAQIEAFRHDDADAAFALASPNIQARFGTAKNFIAMVRAGYQAVYRPRLYRFLEVERVEGQIVQKVIAIGPDGKAVVALYPMARLNDGSWRTDGCYLVPLEEREA